MGIQRVWWCVFLIACGKGGDGGDRCARAFDQLVDHGAFGGQSYSGQIAIEFGIACADLTADDFTCIAGLKGNGENHCDHASEVMIDVHDRMTAGRRGSAEAKPAPSGLDALATAVCGCKTPTCVVGVGEKHRALLNQLIAAPPVDDARADDAMRKLGECLAKLPPFPRAGEKVAGKHETASTDTTRLAVRRLAADGFATWSRSNMSRACPGDISELHDAVGTPANARNDAWGQPFRFFCGDSAPPGVHGIGVLSLGPDGQQGTADDVKSWDGPVAAEPPMAKGDSQEDPVQEEEDPSE
jgi:hypothetical protein